MLQLIDRLGRLAGKVFHRVRIAQPVRPFDGVIHVPLPVIRSHVRQARGDATLRCHRVTAGREYLGDTGGPKALLGHSEGCAKARAPGADNNDVVVMCL